MENFFLTKLVRRHLQTVRGSTPTRSGFTLLEVLIVIAIIGILVSMGVVSYSSAQRKTRNSKRRGDVKAIQTAWEQYYADNSSAYPATCTISATYMPSGLPTDPKPPAVYAGTCTASTYCFCGLLESETGNASNASCGYGAGNYFCVSNLQ